MDTSREIFVSHVSVGEQKGWDLRRRGFKDSLRHDQRVKEAVKKNLRELIAEEAIITSDGNRRVRIPLRYLDQYRFKYGQPQQGVGQGAGQPGDVIGRRAGDGSTPGGGMPGDQPGEHMYEVEVSLEELTQMMLEDLALPWLEEKPRKEVKTTTLEWTDERRTGPPGNLKKRKSLIRNIARNAAEGKPAKVANLKEADLRFRAWDEQEEFHANAAVYMLMDVSGSMTTDKKYIAKSFFFWMVRFLQLKYQAVEMVFIAHDVDAKVIEDEKDFFALSNSGGTLCSSAYQVALEHLQAHHPATGWNNYLFHFSDGDNLPSDNETCKALAETLLGHCQMVGYGEIRYGDDASFYGWIGQTSYIPSSLQGTLKKISESNPRFLSVTITHKEELYQVLQSFLQPQEKIAT